MKKLTSLLLVLFAALLLVGCSCDPGGKPKPGFEGGYASVVDPDGYEYEDKTVLKEGFISLASNYPNPPAQGKAGKDGLGKTYTIAGQEFAIKNVYKGAYSSDTDQQHFDYLVNSWAHNSEKYTNMVEGLIENDKHGALVGALAKGYKLSEDASGKKDIYTFQLYEGVQWVENEDCSIHSEVVAEDFVTGLKYVLNPKVASGTVGIVTDLIDGAKEYYNAWVKKNDADSYDADPAAWKAAWIAANTKEGEEAPSAEEAEAAGQAAKAAAAEVAAYLDFAKVGVKAKSKYEVEYTLTGKVPYFISNLTYSPFLPVSAAYLEEVGSDFGIDENHILVNGAYRITRYDRASKIEYTANTKYFKRESVYADHIELLYYGADISTYTKLREWFESGAIDSFTVVQQDEVGFKKYVKGADDSGTLQDPAHPLCNAVTVASDANFAGFFNYNRQDFDYPAGESKTDAQKAAAQKAIRNKNFRLGFVYGMNLMEQLAYYNPAYPEQRLIRHYTLREFAYDQNGKDYADHLDEVWREEQGISGEVSLTASLNGPGSGDPVYDAEKSAQYFATAKAELIAGGLTEADFPIIIDTIGSLNAEFRVYQKALLDSITASSAGVVEVTPRYATDATQNQLWVTTMYNYDFSLSSGWGPDYADPKTFLHTMIVDGDMVENMGFDTESLKSAEIAALQQEILGPYTAKYDIGDAIVDPNRLDERYRAFAEAEYAALFEEGIIFPWLSRAGSRAVVARTIPFQAGKSTYGLTADKFKNVVVSSEAITKTQRAAIVAAYNAEVE